MFRDEDTSAGVDRDNSLETQGPSFPYCGCFNVQANVKHKSIAAAMSFFTLTGSDGGDENAVPGMGGAFISSWRASRRCGCIANSASAKAAWFMLHRLRAFEEEPGQFLGPVEVDETQP